MRYLLLIPILLLSIQSCYAENDHPAGTRIDITASAETEVANDEVVIIYRIDKEGADAGKVRAQVNDISHRIYKKLKSLAGLKLKTTDRNMQPIWHHPKNKPRVRTGWRITQSEQIVSTNLALIAKVVNSIESEGALISTLQFRIKQETLKQTRASLRLEAIRAFRDQAATLAKALDATSFRIIHLNSNDQMPRPVQYRTEMVMMAKVADASAPSLSSGEGKVSVSINGIIEIPFNDFPVK